jgi:hypothetical protein
MARRELFAQRHAMATTGGFRRLSRRFSLGVGRFVGFARLSRQFGPGGTRGQIT